MRWKKKSTALTEYPKSSAVEKTQAWADDIYAQQQRSTARYQAAFLTSMGLNGLALIAITALSNVQTLVPLLVHHYEQGVTIVEPLTQKQAPMNQAQVESDLVRYVIQRESYDMTSYRAQFDLVNLLSNATVAAEYSRSQSARDPESPIQRLNHKRYRQVHIYGVQFIDQQSNNQHDRHKNHHNLAEVIFRLTDIDKATGEASAKNYNALISWRYTQPSSSPNIRWQNFDGFEVTRYTKQLRQDPLEKNI